MALTEVEKYLIGELLETGDAWDFRFNLLREDCQREILRIFYKYAEMLERQSQPAAPGMVDKWRMREFRDCLLLRLQTIYDVLYDRQDKKLVDVLKLVDAAKSQTRHDYLALSAQPEPAPETLEER